VTRAAGRSTRPLRDGTTMRVVSDSPISRVLEALHALDLDAAVGLFAPDGRLLITTGGFADGAGRVREVLAEFMAPLRAMTHEVSASWHPEDGVWIAELNAHYELKDGERHGPYPRAIVLRGDENGISELRIYGSHELPLTAHAPYREVRTGARWLPTL
jgi:SnoaL-like domain